MVDDLGIAGMPALLMQAAQQAAQADGVLDLQQAALQQARNAIALAAAVNARQQQHQQVKSSSKKKGPPLRRGKWTPEEEAYAARLIHEFKAGLLPLTDGTTLRTFLSKLLNCDPMRISKKFVGNNCIGKQVFRRRTADLNRLTPEQIQQSRVELSDLERRFLERVAQTNRVKTNGCASTPPPPAASQKTDRDMLLSGGVDHSPPQQQQQQQQQQHQDHHFEEAPIPPWLQPPLGYKHGGGQAFAAHNNNNLSSANARAAAAGRALLGASSVSAASKFQNASTEQLAAAAQQGGSTGLLAMAELQRRASQSSLLQSALQQQQQQNNNASASDLLAAAVRSGSNSALQQMARNASAARLAGHFGGNNGNSSMNSLMLKTGLSRDQLSQLARDRGLSSSGSLSNMIQRQNSFDALMSLDFQSLQSIDNLANLIQTGGVRSNMPESGIKNADFSAVLSAANSRHNLANAAAVASSGDLSDAARHLASAASANRMDALLRNLSNNNMGRDRDISSATLSNLLQSMQANLNQFAGQGNSSSTNFFNNNGGAVKNNPAQQSALNFASFLRPDSSTGLSALRMQDGLNQRNSSSVDDFLSLVAAGDIPHQDPNLLNVPLMQQQEAAAKILAQQQLFQASNNSSLANALAGRSFNSMAAPSSNNLSSAHLSNSSSAAALAMAQARAAGNAGSKRSMDFLSGDHAHQGSPKR